MLILFLVQVAYGIRMANRMFTDDSGRSLIFHGMNVVVKEFPYTPITDHFDPQMSLSSEDISNLSNWGFNFIRLGVMWEAVERSPGWYNETYLAEMDVLIRELGSKGIYTLVDAHQDAFARAICGEGVPNFYAQYLDDSCGIIGSLVEFLGGCKPFSAYNMTMDEYARPKLEDCLKNTFVEYYATPEGQSGFERLYKNKYGLQDKFLMFWETVSEKFKDNPYVLGYDLINEPQTANIYKEPWLLLPGNFDKMVLQPLYQNVHKAIRKHDDKKILFFEPTQLDMFPLDGGFILNTGFTETPGGPDYNDRQILNDHTYCCQAGADVCAGGEPPLSSAPNCKRFNSEKVRKRSQDAEALGVGLIISEFGSCFNTLSCVHEITSVADACDEHLVGWSYWMFKGYNDFTSTANTEEGLYDGQGNLQTLKLKALSRTYIQAYQGIPKSSSYSNGVYKSVYTLNSTIPAPTVLYLNTDLFYKNGYSLNVTNSLGLRPTIDKDKNFISILFIQGDTSETTVEVTPL